MLVHDIAASSEKLNQKDSKMEKFFQKLQGPITEHEMSKNLKGIAPDNSNVEI